MKLITRDTDYAIRALCAIAKSSGKIVKTDVLIKETKVPRPFLRKILQILNKNGILNSYKGQAGGFVLAYWPEKIYLIDLIKIFQGPLKLNECLFKKRACPNRSACVLRSKINLIENHVIEELKNITIGSLL